MNKINNILEYFHINENINSNIIQTRYINNGNNYIFNNKDILNSYILNNSLIISELDDYKNSYLLYYKPKDEPTSLITYIIKEGNGLYNYEKYHSLFFNIDDNSIKESYNKLFVDTNFIDISNDNTYNYGISYIDNNYIVNKENHISINNDFISYFIEVKNKLNYLYEKYINIYNKISYYNTISKKYNNIYDYEILYNYKDIEIKFIDKYYFTNNILDNTYSDYYITLPKNSNIIYFKNINLLNICLEVKSNFLYNLYKNEIINSNNYDYFNVNNGSDIYGKLKKSKNNSSYFPSIIGNMNKTEQNNLFVVNFNNSSYYETLNISYNTIYLENNTDSHQNLLNNYGSEIDIEISPNTLSYINTKHILEYNLSTYIENDSDSDSSYDYLSYTLIPYETIEKYIPKVDHIKFAFDNRNITNGTSFFNSNIKSSYICLLDTLIKNNSSISIENDSLIEKLLEKNIIWYNYDEVIHYGYNYLYIDNRNDLYIKKYSPIFQNISTKIINFNFLSKYLNNNLDIPNITSMDIENVLCKDMNSYVYSKSNNTNNYAYVYKYSPSLKTLTLIEENIKKNTLIL